MMTNLPADLSPETAAWLHTQIAISTARAVAPLREELDKVDDWAGGLFVVCIGGFVSGESMFHTAPDASKVALVRLMVELAALGVTLLDVQWLTEHLGTLGAYEVTRDEYLRRARAALALPTAPWTRTGPVTGADVVAEHRLIAP